ncbi:hypothetical protein Q7C36_017583 [Tachysurus vachellii]|uniref:Uncharacterized protein n=1 Tax=Tachysurus vachellii TaxID=175792 RepID=A0AA88M376_TACVA|nr:hypothetical protein Q7C36_017583 [Tachysurus vachellii]
MQHHPKSFHPEVGGSGSPFPQTEVKAVARRLDWRRLGAARREIPLKLHFEKRLSRFPPPATAVLPSTHPPVF